MSDDSHFRRPSARFRRCAACRVACAPLAAASPARGFAPAPGPPVFSLWKRDRATAPAACSARRARWSRAWWTGCAGACAAAPLRRPRAPWGRNPATGVVGRSTCGPKAAAAAACRALRLAAHRWHHAAALALRRTRLRAAPVAPCARASRLSLTQRFVSACAQRSGHHLRVGPRRGARRRVPAQPRREVLRL